jgi:hypothetical protein
LLFARASDLFKARNYLKHATPRTRGPKTQARQRLRPPFVQASGSGLAEIGGRSEAECSFRLISLRRGHLDQRVELRGFSGAAARHQELRQALHARGVDPPGSDV